MLSPFSLRLIPTCLLCDSSEYCTRCPPQQRRVCERLQRNKHVFHMHTFTRITVASQLWCLNIGIFISLHNCCVPTLVPECWYFSFSRIIVKRQLWCQLLCLNFDIFLSSCSCCSPTLMPENWHFPFPCVIVALCLWCLDTGTFSWKKQWKGKITFLLHLLIASLRQSTY